MRDSLDSRDVCGSVENVKRHLSVQSYDANARHLLKVLIQRDHVRNGKPLHHRQGRAIGKTPLLIMILREDYPSLLNILLSEIFQPRCTAIKDSRPKSARTISMTACLVAVNDRTLSRVSG